MIVIRLSRTSKKNQPFFRVVVCDKRSSAKAGRSLEILGFVNPLTKQKNLKTERLKYWLSVGAQPSFSVHNLLVQEGIIKEEKIAVHSRRPGKKKREAREKQDKEMQAAQAKTDPVVDKAE